MKANEESLDDTGFEEIPSEEKKDVPAKGTNRPDISVVQTEVDREGKTKYTNVGGIWKNISKNGKEFYVIKIGNLRLVGFPNSKE